jgi:hypothetical protein
MGSSVTITEAITRLREQLKEAQRASRDDKDLRFLVKSVEVELGIEFRTELEGGASVKAWFLDASGKGTSANETTHKITLMLEPVGRDNAPLDVSSDEHVSE